MRLVFYLAVSSWLTFEVMAELTITSFSGDGALVITNTFTNGVCTVEKAERITGPWEPAKNVFTTNAIAEIELSPAGGTTFYRSLAVDLSEGRPGFTNLTESYSLLTTIAGAGGSPESTNKWMPEFEGGPATDALLSRPHIAI